VRGDLIKVANPGIDEFFAEHTDEPVDQTYILPQGDFLLLGGTAAVGETSLAPDVLIAQGIVERCVMVDSRLTAVPVLEHRVGLRPNRTEIRLEPERVGASTIIHNYGHGGGGVTLSWGCAEEVRELVEKVRAT
jgi:D-amino-acid oxidase